MISVYEQRGIVKGYREGLLTFLRAKFGTLPDGVTAKIDEIEEVEELEVFVVKAVNANSLEETGLTEN